MSGPDSVVVPPPQDEEDSSTLPSLSKESISEKDQSQEPSKPAHQSSLIFSILWPPTQRTRDAVTNRLFETLSTSAVVSKRYGTMPQEEATANARLIEEEAFATADDARATEGDGIEILNLYSKEISKRMLEMVKARASAASAEENGVSSVISTSTGKEISTIDNES